MSMLAPTAPQKQHSIYHRWRTYLLQTPLIGLSTVFFGSLSLTASLWDRSGRQQHAIARAWAKMLLQVSWSPVKVIGAERLQQNSAAVYTVNHLSYMDTPVIFSHLPFQFRILARHDLWKIPFMGWHLKRSGQIPVDSSSLRSQVASLNRGVAALKDGMPLVVFPEGGRTSDGHPKSFMSGPAWMAIRAQVPIVPMALVGTYELLPMHVYHLRPRPLLLVIGEPIPTMGLTTKDVDALTAQTHDAISEMYYRYSELTAEASQPAEQTM